MYSDFELGERLIAKARAILRRRMEAEAEIVCERKNGDHRDLVTECDLAVERMMRDELARERPADLVLAEEGAAPDISDNARVWIIDPIDGTTNFLRWGRNYAISLALWEAKRPVFGILYDAAASRSYSAVPGDGIKADDLHLPPPCDSAPAEGDPLNGMLLDASLNTIASLMRRGVDIDRLSERLMGHRSLGCASLAILRVATGELDAFVSDRLRPWDWAAADVMLREVGGLCTGLYGRKLDPYDPTPIPFLAARSPEAAAALMEALAIPATIVRNPEGPDGFLTPIRLSVMNSTSGDNGIPGYCGRSAEDRSNRTEKGENDHEENSAIDVLDPVRRIGHLRGR